MEKNISKFPNVSEATKNAYVKNNLVSIKFNKINLSSKRRK